MFRITWIGFAVGPSGLAVRVESCDFEVTPGERPASAQPNCQSLLTSEAVTEHLASSDERSR